AGEVFQRLERNRRSDLRGIRVLRVENYSAACTASERLSSDWMMCPASASASADESRVLRTRPMLQPGSSGKPSAAVRTRMPGRKPDSGSIDTARPASTAAATAPAFELE